MNKTSKNLKKIAREFLNKKNIIKNPKKVALHIHSKYSYDVCDPHLSPENIARKAAKKGFYLISFWDHNTVNAYEKDLGWGKNGIIKKEYNNKTIYIATGLEVSIKKMHFGICGFTKKQYQEIKKFSKEDNLKGLIRYCKNNNIPFISANHIFDTTEGNKLSPLKYILENSKLADAIEYNQDSPKDANLISTGIAIKRKQGIFASPDSHDGIIDECYTICDAKTPQECFKSIKKNNVFLVKNNLKVKDDYKRMKKFIDDAFYYGIKKEALEKIINKEKIYELAQGVSKKNKFIRKIIIFQLNMILNIALKFTKDSKTKINFVLKFIIKNIIIIITWLRIFSIIRVYSEKAKTINIIRKLKKIPLDSI